MSSASSNPEVPGSIPGLHKCADTIMATRMGLIKSGAVHVSVGKKA